MEKFIFFSEAGKNGKETLWNVCVGKVERKEPILFFSHFCGKKAVECGKKVENKKQETLWFSTGFVECGKFLHRDV